MKLNILRHSFHKIQGLTSRYLTNSTSDENTLKGELPNQIAEGRNKTKHMWMHVKSQNKMSVRGNYKSKTSLTTMYNFCTAHLA